ncbi:MAG: 1-phosphofructokinase family hexose kinase [Planctomycetota bacterium]
MPELPRVITVTLNPAVDRLLEVRKLIPGTHEPACEVARTPGGKGVNVSRVLSALGLASIATGFLGEANRREFAEFFADPNVTNEFVTLPGRTRENVTIAERRSGRETHIRDVGLAVERSAVRRLKAKLSSLASPESIVVFSGSLPPGVEPADFAGMLGLCAGGGARVAVDASGPGLRAALDSDLLLLTPNLEELAEIAGSSITTPEEQAAAARRCADRAELVLLSRGRHGACLITKTAAWSAIAAVNAADIKNTVGCGDVLLASFVAGFIRGDDLQEALKRAVATASASACHPLPAAFDPKLAGKLLETAELDELSADDLRRLPRGCT